MMATRFPSAGALALLFASSAMAASALSVDVLLILNPTLPEGVFIDAVTTGVFPLFCAPAIGTGYCLGPTIQNNLAPGLNFGGPYELRWTGQTSYSSAPPPDFSAHTATQQTIYTFGNLTQNAVQFNIPWHMSYLLETDGVASTASISTDIREIDMGTGAILMPFQPIWAGDTISNGNPTSKSGEAAGFITLIIEPLSETNLSVYDPESTVAATPEPHSVGLTGSGLTGLVACWFVRRRVSIENQRRGGKSIALDVTTRRPLNCNNLVTSTLRASSLS